MSRKRILASTLTLLLGTAAAAQTPPPGPPPPEPTHDISQVDVVAPGAAIAIPLPEKERKRLKKYDIPELVGARQALGSQLVDGELPKPILDYRIRGTEIEQQLSIFKGGLVVVRMTGAGGALRKRVIIPPDALAAYRQTINPEALAAVRPGDVTPPEPARRSLLRAYRDDGSNVELTWDPAGVLPKNLSDQIRPLEDLLRAISEDRTVTSSVAGYEPKAGDELVGDDRKLWRVERVIDGAGIVELRCVSQATVIYVDKKYLYNYFIGKPGKAVISGQ